jgi:pimeloyl-ACP methyl ester carboxylesterase
MKTHIVFGGWAVDPELIPSPTEDFDDDGDDCVDYIDVNYIMPKLFDSHNKLRSDWPEIVMSECSRELEDGNAMESVLGWSAGAMFAYAAARICRPKELALWSATPCFCRKDDFRFGTRPEVLDQMISALHKDREAVLQSFYEKCGLEYDPDLVPPYETDALVCGLEFLKQADLRPLAPLSAKTAFLHGSDDEIVPVSAGKYFCEQVKGDFIEVDGGHSLFLY